MPSSPRMSAVLTGGACVVLALAGAGKLLDLVAFQESLVTWRLLPEWVRWSTTFALRIAEVSCFLLWCDPRRRRSGEWVTLCIALALASVSGLHVVLGEKPTCNCLGVLDQYFRFKASSQMLVWKSAAIGAALAAGIWLKAPKSRSVGEPQ